ncbi:MAG TPA: hypothetical protein VK863_04575, partial [Candidatus Limnocylindrales bacterium]|nr:hypothetical protein [Candidatus Limnocylindrales bacterium]
MPARRRKSLFLALFFPLVLSACSFVADGTLSIRLSIPPDNAALSPAAGSTAGTVRPLYSKSPDNRILIRVLAPHIAVPMEAWFDRSAGRGEITGIPPGTRIVVEVDEYDNTARTLLTNAPLLGRGWAQGITLSPGEFREVSITMYDKGTIVRVCGAAPASGAGTSGDTGDGGLAVDALLDNPLAVKVGPGDEVFVSSSQYNRIRKIDRYGYISHYAGNGTVGTVSDGQPAAIAPIGSTWDMDIGPSGDLFLITGDQQIFRIDAVTRILSVKYNGQKGIFSPSAKTDLAVASENEIYYTNGMENKVYLVQGGVRSDYVWDNGTSSTAEGVLKNNYPPRYPSSVSFNPAIPILYFADRDNDRIKFVAMGVDKIYTKIGVGASSFLEGIDADNVAIILPILCEYDVTSHSLFFRERDFHGIRVV